ncbi:MAG: hypothetical protein K8U03_22760 [Planctomycetia bacterium]|nr:hypothetical protein [Planctomycetia bacterium]
MSTSDPHSPQAEHRHHAYVTNRIPWYVRAVWIGFWVFAVYYTVTYLFPTLQKELVIPPTSSTATN